MYLWRLGLSKEQLTNPPSRRRGGHRRTGCYRVRSDGSSALPQALRNVAEETFQHPTQKDGHNNRIIEGGSV